MPFQFQPGLGPSEQMQQPVPLPPPVAKMASMGGLAAAPLPIDPIPQPSLASPTTAFVPTIEVKLDGSPAAKPKRPPPPPPPAQDAQQPAPTPAIAPEPPIFEGQSPSTSKPKTSARKSKHRGSISRQRPEQPMGLMPFLGGGHFMQPAMDDRNGFRQGNQQQQMTAMPVIYPTDNFVYESMENVPGNPNPAALAGLAPSPLRTGPPLSPGMPPPSEQFQNAPASWPININPQLAAQMGHMSMDQAARFFPWTYSSESEQRYHETLYHSSLLLEATISYVLHIFIGMLAGACLLSMLVLPIKPPPSTTSDQALLSTLQLFLGFFSPYALHVSRLFNFLSTVSLVGVINIVSGTFHWTKPKLHDQARPGVNARSPAEMPVDGIEASVGGAQQGHNKSSTRWVVQVLMCLGRFFACEVFALFRFGELRCLLRIFFALVDICPAAATCFLSSIFSTPIDDSLYFSENGGGTGRYGSSGW